MSDQADVFAGLDGKVHIEKPHDEAPADAYIDFSIVSATGVSAAVYLTLGQAHAIASALIGAPK